MHPVCSHHSLSPQLTVHHAVYRYVNYFAARASPTASLLDLWFARQAEPASAAAELLNMLTNMGRQDAARILQAHLAPNT